MSGDGAQRGGRLTGPLLRPTAKAVPGDARTHNRSLVLSSLFHRGPLSRADLARTTGLTRVTVSDLITELAGQALVQETGSKTEARVGKPGTLVDIDSDGHVMAVLDLSDTATARGAVITLRGTVVARAEQPTNGATGQAMLRIAQRTAEQLLAQTGPAKPLGLGVASPGVLTPDGQVVYAKDYQWNNLPLAAGLAASLGQPVAAANDANLRALAEFTYAGASAEGLMEVSLTDGLGAGILLDGFMLLGPSNAAGEIGHIPAMVGGDPCSCGRRGCLETVLNREVLRKANGTASGMTDKTVLKRVGTATAAVLAPIVSAFNLSDLVFADPRGLATPDVLAAIRQGLEERLLPQIMADLNVRVSQLGADAALLGAGSLVLANQLGVT